MMQTERTNLSAIRKANIDSIQRQPIVDTTLAIAGLPLLVLLDRDGSIYSCSEEVAALAGLTPQQLIGQPVKRLLPAHCQWLPRHQDTTSLLQSSRQPLDALRHIR